MNAELVYPSRVCVLKASLHGAEDGSLETLCSDCETSVKTAHEPEEADAFE